MLLGSICFIPTILLGQKTSDTGYTPRAGRAADKHLEECNSHVQAMGRGRKGILDQSQKKVKTTKNTLRDQHTLFISGPVKGENTEPPIPISEELLTQMKKMSPQDLKNALIKPKQEEQEDLYEVTDFEEPVFEWIDPTEPVYERPIPTPELFYQMMTTMTKDQVRYVIEKSLAL